MILYVLGKMSLMKLFRFIAFELFINPYILRNNTEIISYFIHLNSCISFVGKIVIANINILHKPLTKTVRLNANRLIIEGHVWCLFLECQTYAYWENILCTLHSYFCFCPEWKQLVFAIFEHEQGLDI